MNLIRRAAISTQLSSHPPPQRLPLTPRSTIPIHQVSPFSIFAKNSSTNHTLKSQQPQNPNKQYQPNSWRDLVKNPTDWLDYRNKKSIGSVKSKHPDFKHKTNGTALWLDSAPNCVLAGLARLNVGGGENKENLRGSKEDSWKNLIEHPDKWWDNRSTKMYANSSDFKHKETGEKLWLNGAPHWVLSQLPC